MNPTSLPSSEVFFFSMNSLIFTFNSRGIRVRKARLVAHDTKAVKILKTVIVSMNSKEWGPELIPVSKCVAPQSAMKKMNRKMTHLNRKFERQRK
ncbi:unnamed protein product [Sphenostylis stenocarpa]|uniref:Uncharacterized protein n=1 Tax=Sphenostylis stenocarpa TaxID=92480 RepID=A0AA86T872_9FABA|nr:unnamed protein product [Sphenostylis stenocarpa]